MSQVADDVIPVSLLSLLKADASSHTEFGARCSVLQKRVRQINTPKKINRGIRED